MITTNATINELVRVYVQTTPNLPDLSNFTVCNNGEFLDSVNGSVVETSLPGLYCISYIPSATGRSVLLFNDLVVAYVEVVSRNVYSYLKNIEDESLGSWTWDKALGELKLLKQDGTPLAQFDVTDTAALATRERTL